MFDVDIIYDNQSEFHVELLPGEPRLEVINIKLNWSSAERFCVSIHGGHLESVPSAFRWQKLKNFIVSNNLEYEMIWLGGTDEAREGEWSWTDRSMVRSEGVQDLLCRSWKIAVDTNKSTQASVQLCLLFSSKRA